MEGSSCHPALLFDDALEVLFKIMPFEELKDCRQVCQTWEEISRKFVKSRSQLRLTADFALVEFLRQDSHFFIPSKLTIDMHGWRGVNVEGDQQADNEGFQKEMEDFCGILERHSFEELEISKFEYSEYFAGHWLSIFRHLSTSLKSLEVCKISAISIISTIDIEQPSLDVCPSLTKLSIGSAPEKFHKWILSACPNLTEINGNYEKYEEEQCQLIVLRNANGGGLTKISGFSCSTQEEMEILGRKSGNLEELSLEVKERVEDSVLGILQSKKESLTFLELAFRKIPETLRLGQGFIQLTKVQLEIGDYIDSDADVVKPFALDVCFSRDIPKLKYFKLKVHGDGYDWKDALAYRSNTANGGRVIPQLNLTHLDLYVGGRVGRECADYLRQLFPSLTSFKIQRPTEDFLLGLWEMRSLVELLLELVEDYCHDYDDIQDVGVALFGTPQSQEVEESIHGILNLKNLRHLSILKFAWNREGPWIPKEIVRNGFGKMKGLAVLNLSDFCMSPEANAFLWANLPDLKELKLGRMMIPSP